jgi:hypothetical protein
MAVCGVTLKHLVRREECPSAEHANWLLSKEDQATIFVRSASPELVDPQDFEPHRVVVSNEAPAVLTSFSAQEHSSLSLSPSRLLSVSGQTGYTGDLTVPAVGPGRCRRLSVSGLG